MAKPTPTWKPHEVKGKLDAQERNELPDSVYAFPKQRKEPLTDASHVRNAVARFDQVEDVSERRPRPGLGQHPQGGRALQGRSGREGLARADERVRG